MKFYKIFNLKSVYCPRDNSWRHVHYVQGQCGDKNIREYFYYIDHQGMLFLDDARMKNFTSCFKEPKFLQFFFKRLKRNNSGRYVSEFPYISICGVERNYIRCDDLPLVFTQVLEDSRLACNHAGQLLTEPFQPSKLVMSLSNGRIYHPGPPRVGGIGLIRSQIAIEFSKSFQFDPNGNPTHFRWKNEDFLLNNQWFLDLNK